MTTKKTVTDELLTGPEVWAATCSIGTTVKFSIEEAGVVVAARSSGVHVLPAVVTTFKETV